MSIFRTLISKGPAHLKIFKKIAALALLIISMGCGRANPAAAEQELAVRALTSDISAVYSDVQALKSEQGLIFEQLESQNSVREEATASSQGELKRLRALAGKGAQSQEQLQQLRQRLEDQNSQIERLRSDILQLKRGVETVANAISNQTDQPLSGQIYLVQPGDTLEKIARKSHCSIDALRRINHLPNDLIVAGKKLQLP